MNFGFSEQQEELRAAARDLLASECPTAVVRHAADDPAAWKPLWKALTDVGWTSLTLPEAAGGSGLGTVDLVALVEVAGAHLLPAPFVSSVALAAPVLAAVVRGDHPALRAIAAGEPAALAVHGPAGSTHDPADGVRWDGGRLAGRKGLVADADRASWLVVVADGDGSPVVAAVPRPSPGVEVVVRPNVDPTRPVGELDLRVDGAEILSGGVDRGLDVARTALAAELVGVAGRALDLAVDHARSRQQFGRPIGSFQAVKHRLADAYVAVERARTLTYRAAMLLDDPRAPAIERSVAVAMAKAAASEAGVGVCKTAVQTFGAIGTTWEHDVHLFLRRARQSAALLGDHRHHYRRVGGALVAGASS